MKVVFRVTVACAGLLLVLPGEVRAQLTAEQKAKLPPAADHKVSFAKEIYPLLEQSCTKCHGKGKSKGRPPAAATHEEKVAAWPDKEKPEVWDELQKGPLSSPDDYMCVCVCV